MIWRHAVILNIAKDITVINYHLDRGIEPKSYSIMEAMLTLEKENFFDIIVRSGENNFPTVRTIRRFYEAYYGCNR